MQEVTNAAAESALRQMEYFINTRYLDRTISELAWKDMDQHVQTMRAYLDMAHRDQHLKEVAIAMLMEMVMHPEVCSTVADILRRQRDTADGICAIYKLAAADGLDEFRQTCKELRAKQ